MAPGGASRGGANDRLVWNDPSRESIIYGAVQRKKRGNRKKINFGNSGVLTELRGKRFTLKCFRNKIGKQVITHFN
jgi:hypothetical protein